MEITSSYQVEILSNTDMKNTVQIYRRTLAFVIDVCDKEWGNISVLGGTKEKDHYVEKLIHPTKNNPNPKYPFDIKGSEFYKFPYKTPPFEKFVFKFLAYLICQKN